ncbi:MAG TPA: NHLP bacteriocin export ABC transporter permease/ATPase subunit, partial [Longimicrobiaceae bacterium]|nr:NHLP bacteriocin export ABC transporter permease/ATPase subunit [Longimicrobiaceae bacterium]
MLEEWIGWLYGVVAPPGKVPKHQNIGAGAETEIEPGVNVCAETPGWIRVTEGSGTLLGRAEVAVEAGGVVPAAEGSWLRTAQFSTLRLVSTPELLEEPEGHAAALAGAEQVHRLALRLVAERLREEEEARRERARKQAQATQAAMAAAVTRLATTMEAGEARSGILRMSPRGAGEPEEDSLFPAFRLVAAAEGIQVAELRRRHEAVKPKDPISALARSYRVRTRRVALRPNWWKRDCGPLLGRLEGRPRAVALLPVPGGGYEVVDPHDRTRTKLDAKVAGTLGAFGYALYRPFGAEAQHAWDLLRFGLYGCRRDLLAVALAGIVMALLGMVTPLAIGALYNTVIPGAERGQLVQLTLALVVTGLAVALFSLVRGFALLRIEARVGPRLQAAVWDRLLTLPLPFFRDYTAGDLAVRAMGVEEMRTIASGTVVTVLLSGLFSLSNFALLFSYAPKLAWIAIALVVTAAGMSTGVSYLQLRSQRAILKVRSATSGLVLQLLTGIPKLKVVGAEVQGFGLWARMFSEQREAQFRTRRLGIVLTVFTGAFPLLSTLALFYFATRQMMPVPGQTRPPEMLRTGDFLGFMAAFTGALGAVLASANAVVASLSIVPLYEQIQPILQGAPEVHAGKQDPGELTGAIEMQHVTFRYLADGPPVLHDLSIRVEPGEFVALVGASGSGKSTTLRLLLGFESPESGSVSFDQQELSALDLEAVRRQIGVVVQSGKLMAGDIFTNIVGSSTATLDDAWEAAKMAGLDDDIREMPMGMHTVVSDGGGTLSGGQRQRLMIARALVHRPRILFFDEATSALDNRTQDVVSKSLDRMRATRIVVAHRLSTVRNADRIYVVHHGSVAEQGSFDEL